MPKSWYDRHVVNKFDDDSKKDFYRSIVADKILSGELNVAPSVILFVGV